MDRVWLSAPAAALHIRRDAFGVQVQANDAAARWAAGQGLTTSDWQPLGALLAAPPAAAAVELEIGRRRLSFRPVPLADGSLLVWLDLPPDGERAFDGAGPAVERALLATGVAVWRIDLRRQWVHFDAAGFEVSAMQPGPAGVPLAALRETVHPDDLAGIELATARAIAGEGVVDVVARFRNADGSWRPLLTRRVAVRDERGDVAGLCGISLDLSPPLADRERAEALVERARLVAEAIGVGLWSRDIDAGTGHWDEQMYRIHRRDPRAGPPGYDEWIDQYVHPADRAAVQDVRRRAAASWEPVVDALFRTPDRGDGERWVHTWTRRMVRDGHRLTFGMHLDVTDRQREQALLQRERARVQIATEAAGVGIWERGLDGRITFWNEAMYRLRGLDPADPRPIEEVAASTSHPDDHAEMERLVRRHLADGAPYRHELRVRRADAGWRWLVTQGRALRDPDGHLIGMAGINLDITERKEADALRQQKAQVEQASRDKSEFMSRVSHELRTPMNAVLGFAQLLEDDPSEPPTPRQRARLQRIEDAGAQMMALVDDLLDLASLDAGAPPAGSEGLPAADTARQVLESLAPLAAQHGVALREGPLVGGGRVQADRRRLNLLLSNLVAHAVRRQPRGGWVEVSASLDEGPPPQLRFDVRDGGPAYGEAEQASLFEPFVRHGRGAPATSGTGIGLSLAQRLVHALGGSLEVAGAAGGGNEFRLRLPADDAAAVPPGPPPLPADEIPALPLSVVCIEDNPVNLLLVRELLALRPGVTLHAAVDGQSGIELALAVEPDVLLLDLQLPDMHGHDVLARLRAEPAMAGCVCVALSANAMPDHIAAARAAGFDDYWTKPIDFARFLAGIDSLAYGANLSRSQASVSSR